jgi:hypothetical protein
MVDGENKKRLGMEEGVVGERLTEEKQDSKGDKRMEVGNGGEEGRERMKGKQGEEHRKRGKRIKDKKEKWTREGWMRRREKEW